MQNYIDDKLRRISELEITPISMDDFEKIRCLKILTKFIQKYPKNPYFKGKRFGEKLLRETEKKYEKIRRTPTK